MIDFVFWRFTDPLKIADDYEYTATSSTDVQRFADRAYLLVRVLGYPVFHDPTLVPWAIHVTRFDPSDMRPIEPVGPMPWQPEESDITDTMLGRYERSAALRPCIYVADADFIRALVARGNPPVFS